MSKSIDFQGAVVLITGGSRGLGLAQAAAFKATGAQVAITARDPDTLEQACETLDAAPGLAVRAYAHDMRDHAGVGALVDRIEQEVGAIQSLVNNAGVHLKKPVWDVAFDEWNNVVDINLTGVFTMTREVLRHMVPRKAGSIVNISSMGGLMALPSATAYVTTKTALIGFTRSVAVDAGAHSIRCNAVCPGFIDTEMTRKVLAGDPARSTKIRGRIPMPRLGQGEDIANACVFLCSEMASYINGQSLAIDGGYSIGF
ncbi:MAG: SDR family NAD(P)-dependent oxidoreductase [Burkholderiaceae bacterium]